MKQIINNTALSAFLKKHKHNDELCFNKTMMNHLFAFKRRKYFMHFLVENGFELFGQKLLIENEHRIFDTHDINYYIMSFL